MKKRIFFILFVWLCSNIYSQSIVKYYLVNAWATVTSSPQEHLH